MVEVGRLVRVWWVVEVGGRLVRVWWVEVEQGGRG